MTSEATSSGASEKKSAAAEGSAELSDEHRDEMASRLVDRFSVWGGAAGLIPIPIVDVATVSGVQLVMLRRLSEIYGVAFTENRGKSIIASLAGSLIPASSTLGLASAFKAVPIVGTAVSSVIMPIASAGATWVVGKVFIQHFASGGTLLDFNPPDYREFIKTHKEKWNARSASAADKSAAPSSTSSSTSSSSSSRGAKPASATT